MTDYDGVLRAPVPDERLGEIVAVVVVGRPEAPIRTDELIEWLRGRLASYMVPTRVWGKTSRCRVPPAARSRAAG